MKIYFLQNYYEENHMEYNTRIAVYSSQDIAEKGIEKFTKQRCFSKNKDDFYISEYVVDKNYWQEGFFLWDK